MTDKQFDDELLRQFGPVRRHSEPMDFQPAWYREAKRDTPACTGNACAQGRAPCQAPDACGLSDDSEFGAIGSIVSVWPWLLKAWGLIAACVLFFWFFN